jgi:SAM-dependent methyltransferase
MPGSYDAELYDLVTPNDIFGDVAWYCDIASRSGGPVLELGAGTGRITLAIAARGIAIDALDSHEGMQAALARKLSALPAATQSLVRIVRGDMARFELERRFALVIVPFRAFLHNLTRDAQLACLRQVHKHLRAGGQIAFNVFHPSLEFMSQHAGPLAGVWRWQRNVVRDDGSLISVSEANRYDTLKRVVRSQHRYEVYDASGALVRTFLHALELAYLYPGEIERLLLDSGFTDIRIHGGFDGRPLQHDRDELVVVATRA